MTFQHCGHCDTPSGCAEEETCYKQLMGVIRVVNDIEICRECPNVQDCSEGGTCMRVSSLKRRPALEIAGSSAQSVIESREATHGDYNKQALFAQRLKGLMHQENNWPNTTPAMRESLDMIAVKISRILTGNPDEPDHWLDIAGYATLVHNTLTKGTHL